MWRMFYKIKSNEKKFLEYFHIIGLCDMFCKMFMQRSSGIGANN